MTHNLNKPFLDRISEGYAHNKIVLDENGLPCDYEVLEVNSAFEKLTGIKSSEIIGKRVTEVFPDIQNDSFDRIGFYANVALNGEEAEIKQYSKPLGRWYKIYAYCPEKYYFVTLFTDISHDEERFRRLAENSQDLIYRYEFTPIPGFAYVNRVSTSIIGYTPEEHYENPNLGMEIIHPKDKELFAKYAQGLLPFDTPLELRWIHKNGQVVWVEQKNMPIYDSDGNLVALEGVARDITKRKELEENWKASNRVFNHSIDMLCIAGFDGYFKEINPAWSRTLGWSTEELLSKPWIEFVHPGDRKATENVKLTIVDGKEAYQFRNRYVCKDGSIKWLSWNSFPYPDEEIMFGVARDITQKKEIEEREQHLKKVLMGIRNVNQMIVKESRPNELIQKACDNLTETLGYYNAWIALFDEKQDVKLAASSGFNGGFEILKEELEHGHYPQCMEEALKKDETIIIDSPSEKCIDCPLNLEYSGRAALCCRLQHNSVMYGIISVSVPEKYAYLREEHELFEEVAEDIAFALYNRKIEQEKSRHERHIHLMTRNMNDIVIETDVYGNYKYISPSHKKILGKGDELLGLNCVSDIHPDDQNAVMGVFKKIVETGKEGKVEYRYLHPEKGYLWLESIGNTFIKEDGEVSILINTRDITERKKVEDALLRAKILAENSNRTKSQFLANMSHELRTPLNSIIGYSQILSQNLSGNLEEKELRYSSNILNSGEHLLDLINDILDISKVEAGKMDYEPESINLPETIDSVIGLVKPLAMKKSIDTLFINNSDIFEMNADKVKVKQILHNLLSNAIKFTPEKGEVKVYLDNVDGTVQISVSDTGIGIPKEKCDDIFDPFKQVKSSLNREYEGTGLGLALVKKYVQMHGGKIWVESEVGVGSTFTFTIPLK